MTPPSVAGVLLAGGQSRRMGGGDKCLRQLGGRTILDCVLERVRPQVGPLLLNANGDPERFEDFDLPVEPDVIPGFAGPLAGVLTGMEWTARNARSCQWVASFPCDAPFLPRDMVARMLADVSKAKAEMAAATSHGRAHPVFGLWPVSLRQDLRRAVEDEGLRKVDEWTARYRLIAVDFADEETGSGAVDPFFNTNRPEDLEEAERLRISATEA